MQDKSQTVAIIDLGGQYCHLISRRLRELGFRSEILDHDAHGRDVRQYAGLILSGGPSSVYDDDAPKVDPSIIEPGQPILGICYGHQLLAQAMGARVERGKSEFGSSSLNVSERSSLFRGSPLNLRVWMSHSDSVMDLPPGAHSIGATMDCETAAFADESRHWYGVQFHPEVDHTEYGAELLRNFAQICKLAPRDPDASRVDEILDQIREKVADGSVFFLVSGGVDSMVAFFLCARALGRERVLGLYVDTGFMRLGEGDELMANLGHLGLRDRVAIRDASSLFFSRLAGIQDPEEKRRIIGQAFVDVQAQAMQELGIDDRHWFLGQGTIYPDTIESGGKSGRAALIKTHHNRCAEIQALLDKGRVVEPIADLYKDEVRKVGRDLGLSHALLSRWPFPGPGLAIRVLCSSTAAQRIATPLENHALDPYRAYAFPIKTVGVQGDARTYRQMAALTGPLDYNAIQSISSRLCNVNQEFNRVVYVVRTLDQAEIADSTLIAAGLEPKRVRVLQKADAIVRRIAAQRKSFASIWQFPVVLLPITVAGREVIVLRPVDSENGMTANFSRLAPDDLYDIADAILRECEVGAVLLDATDKPPATIEWE
jgi:GMP synthase (glutamine-hydrolysing)